MLGTFRHISPLGGRIRQNSLLTLILIALLSITVRSEPSSPYAYCQESYDEEAVDAAVKEAKELVTAAVEAKKQGDRELAKSNCVRAFATLLDVKAHVDGNRIQRLLFQIGTTADDIEFALKPYEWRMDILSSRPDDDRTRILAEYHYALMRLHNGQKHEARAITDKIIETLELTGRHEDLLWSVRCLHTDVLWRLNAWSAFIEAGEAVVQLGGKPSSQEPLPATILLEIKHKIAVATGKLGDIGRTIAAYRRVLDSNLGATREDKDRLQIVRTNLGVFLFDHGRFTEARDLFLQVIEAAKEDPAANEYYTKTAHELLVRCLPKTGEGDRILSILDAYLEDLEERYPKGHRYIFKIKGLMALERARRMDLSGALREVAGLKSGTGDNDDQSFDSRFFRATIKTINLDFEGSLEDFERLHEELSNTHPDHHNELQRTRVALCAVLIAAGKAERALEIAEKAVAVEAEHHTLEPEMARCAMMCLTFAHTALKRSAASLTEADLIKLRDSISESIDVMASAPAIVAHRCELKTSLAMIHYLLHDHDALEEELSRCAGDEIGWISDRGLHAPREARELAGMREGILSILLSLHGLMRDDLRGDGKRFNDSDLERSLFGLVETLRAISCGSHLIPGTAGKHPVIKILRERLLALKVEINELTEKRKIATGEKNAAARDEAEKKLAEVILMKDRAEEGLRSTLLDLGFFARPIDSGRLAEALPENSAAVGYRVYSRLIPGDDEDRSIRCEPSMMAFVLHPAGELTRIELGPLAAIDRAAMEWRAAVGRPLDPVEDANTSTSSLKADPGTQWRTAGDELRALLLDPILAATGDAQFLHVCLDGPLLLFPLDTLPMNEGLVGDALEIRNEISFARLLLSDRADALEPELLAVGGVDFNTSVEDAPTGLLAEEKSPWRDYEPKNPFLTLRHSRNEALRISELFEKRFDKAAPILEGREATWQAFTERTPHAVYLHIATHGFFAGRSSSSALLKSRSEQLLSFGATVGKGLVPQSGLPMDALGIDIEPDDLVSRFSPMTLCGLALTGANNHRNVEGAMPGIITGEEISCLDLSRCELAVLSACETNVGLRRAGQGILSLQAAFHAAGAQTLVTSLWSVHDEWTRILMEDFYRRIWEEGTPKARALWLARKKLRDMGAEPRHWTAWVLTGDPE